ncbi:MAG: hypothetical protein WCR96_01555 [Candidatus Methanomethylophilaceae archaeon]
MKSDFEKMVKIDWPKIWEKIGTNSLHMVECDDAEGYLHVGVSCDGDFHLNLERGRNQLGMTPSFRARTFAGGGMHEKVRQALALLTLAIIEDTQEGK